MQLEQDFFSSLTVRQIIQCQCLDWADHSVPSSVNYVLTIINEMRSHVTSFVHPVLLHCR